MPRLRHFFGKAGIQTASALLCASFGMAAEPEPDPLQPLIGQWQSFSIISTNFAAFDRATNVTLTVRVRAQGPMPETELRITDRMGRQDPSFQKDGPLLVGEGMIVIGSASRIGFPYQLTNHVLTIEVPIRRNNEGRFWGFKIELKKVDPVEVEHH